MDIKKFEKIRTEQFPLATKCAYLDTATTGIISTRSKNAMVNFIENRYSDGMDNEGFLSNWKGVEVSRKLMAQAINSDSDEIFFSGSGSDMINVFSNGIELKENANIVTSDLSFPSTPYTWFNRVGEKNVRIAKNEKGLIPSNKLFELVDENTSVISLCMVENTTGFCHDIKEIGEFCKSRGIYLVLDITQCIGAMKVDVKDMHVDYLVATSYKWIGGAFGISFAYVSKHIINKIRSTFVGWTGNKDRHNHSRYNLDLSEGANRFETGSLNWIGLKGIEQSIQIYLELGKDEVEEYILSLTEYLYKRVELLKNIGLIGPFQKKNRSGISYLTFPADW